MILHSGLFSTNRTKEEAVQVKTKNKFKLGKKKVVYLFEIQEAVNEIKRLFLEQGYDEEFQEVFFSIEGEQLVLETETEYESEE